MNKPGMIPEDAKELESFAVFLRLKKRRTELQIALIEGRDKVLQLQHQYDKVCEDVRKVLQEISS